MPDHPLPADLAAFLDRHAAALDEGSEHADALVPALGASGLLAAGVPATLGGAGDPLSAGIEAIAAIAERSLAAAFVAWGQRAFIEYLARSPNGALRERWLADALAGRVAGATGLSNAMKFLSGIASLSVHAAPAAGAGARGSWSLRGEVPWATNLRPAGFVVAVAVARDDGGAPFVAALPSDRPGLARSADLDLIALRGTRTASLSLRELPLGPDDILADDARAWLPAVRPAFLGLQCALSIGVARACLDAARTFGVHAKAVLGEPIEEAARELDELTVALLAGVDDGRFVASPVALFELRIRLAEVAMQAAQLELQASGGRAYHRDQPLGFARRWREAAFLPIVTPSLSQLRGELLRHRGQPRLAAAA
jgi:alkylation response protein AidB-like acyl-CoA dehydrogenase